MIRGVPLYIGIYFVLVEAWGFDEHNFYWYWEGGVFFGLSVFAPRREVHMARIWAELLLLFEPRAVRRHPKRRAATRQGSLLLSAGGEQL